MASAEAVAARLKELLPTLDLDQATERSIRQQLAAELGPIDKHKSLIKELVEKFLAEQAANDEDDEDYATEEEEDEEEDTRKTAGKRKGSAKQSAVAKQAKTTAGREYIRVLHGNKRLSLSAFKGRQLVDIREFYKDRDTDEEKPGAKGLALSVEQWLKLRPQLQALQQAVQQSRVGDLVVQLSSDRQAYVTQFNNKHYVNIREMYEKDGKMLPGKKGVALDEAAMNALISYADEVTALVAPGGAPAASSADPAPGARPQKQPAGPKGGQAAPAPAAPTAGSGTGAVDPEAGWDLGGDKRVRVSRYGGGLYVDLREFYTKDGEKLPGKKGIALKPSEYKAVMEQAGAITAAATSGSMNYSLDLGAKRKVALSEFRGKLYVGVREYYEKDGKLLPGQKGLSMTLDQWQALVQAMPAIKAGLEAA